MSPLNSESHNTSKDISKNKEAIFERLYFDFAKKVYVIGKRFHLEHEDCEEIVQEVFTKLWGNMDRLEEETANAYITIIAKNTVLKFIRSKTVRQNYLNQMILTRFETHNNIDDLINYRELHKRLKKALGNLSPQPRMVFEMVKLQELSIGEVAKKVNLSRRTVESHLYKASKYIKAHLNVLISLLLGIFF